MRRPGLLLLILLLALRMWVGEAMAWASPLPPHTQPVTAAPAPCHEAMAGPHASHASHHPAPADASAQVCDAGDDGAAATCGACQVCHSPWLAAPLLNAPAASAPLSARPWAPARFKSVSLPPQFKPPIA